uniref:Halomucin n=1 Tax=Strongyloides papillosus TaxID=174720 RepID=A0A0N5C4I5_STREA
MDNIESDEQRREEGINSDTIDGSVEHRNDVGDISDNSDGSDEHQSDGDDDSKLLDGSDEHLTDGDDDSELLDGSDEHQSDGEDITINLDGSERRFFSESNRYFMPVELTRRQNERVTQTWSCVEKYDVVLNINIRGTVKAFEKYAHCLLTGDDVNIVLGR